MYFWEALIMETPVQNGAIILAGGEGKRMKSSMPKALCEVLFKPMIAWVLDAVDESGVGDVCVVTGHLHEKLEAYIGERCETFEQKERLGTGHAVMQAVDFIKRHTGNILILNGDAPLMDSETIENALSYHINADNAVTVISAKVSDPTGYGRIVRDDAGVLLRITEHADATQEEKKINEVNSGAYWFKSGVLLEMLQKIVPNNAQGEYYLTDAVKLIIEKNLRAAAFTAKNSNVVLGANDRVQLLELNEIVRRSIIRKHLLEGVDIPCADGIIIGPDVVIMRDTRILPNTVLQGETTIGSDCVVGPNSLIDNCKVGNNTVLKNVDAKDSKIGDNVDAGPFVHIRPGSQIANRVHLGNFVEVKNSTIGEGTKVSHLTYVGDSDVGSDVNFGCGCVTVNYNGKDKNRTVIKDHAFIGCNTNLIAPVTVGEYGYTAAGSTIKEDVPPYSLAFERGTQTIKENWVMIKKPFKNM